ncbi:SA1362 family protein [Bacillus sp. CGMCC 1.16541]|uniref:SA1362 family protein n=1 Tax=Bacillus sp. CGMCC 1.16541 TaxID=2185143 RepID=UPI000D73298E|nr:SA1362 family protein [Bacillus sp. CGMCC 1.16541]
MRRSFIKPLLYVLFGLGAFGFIYTLFTNPSSLLRQAGYVFLFFILFYLLYRFVLRPSQTKGQDKEYLRAVKQSKRRLKERGQPRAEAKPYSTVNKRTKQPTTKLSSKSTAPKKKKSNSHLTVIEGKKGKKKNRAFF